MRLALVIATLGPGGAERVLTSLANGWAAEGHDVHLLTLAGRDVKSHYSLDARVHLEPLDVFGGGPSLVSAFGRIAGRVLRLRERFLELRPDVILSFMDATNLLVLLSTRGLRVPVVVSERTDPATAPLSGLRRFMRRLLYPSATRLVVQTARARDYFSWLPDTRVRIIPNAVVIHERGSPSSAGDRPCIRAMGRLSREKGFDVLIEAFARIAPAHLEVTLEILGAGPLLRELEDRCEKLGVRDRVRFPGLVVQPEQVLRGSTIFVLASRREGFPNALLEAMSLGLPVVAMDCPSGPSEIVRHGETGLLVPVEDVQGLADALTGLLADPPLRESLGIRARDSMERFDPVRVQAAWSEALGLPPVEPTDGRS